MVVGAEEGRLGEMAQSVLEQYGREQEKIKLSL